MFVVQFLFLKTVDMEKFFIGKIVKAQGIKGEVKIQSDCGDLSIIKGLKYLILKNQNIAVKSMRINGEFAYVLFSTIADRNQAEELVGLEVFADENNIKLDEDSYFVNDMIGSQVKLDDGQIVGVVDDIMQTSKKAAEIYVVKTNKGNVLFPFLKDLVIGFDKDQKILLLDSNRFAEVSLYED